MNAAFLSRWMDRRSHPPRQLNGSDGWPVPGGTLLRLAAAAVPPGPAHPRGVPAARLVPQWHVTNGDMLLLLGFVRSVALIESKAAGISQIHMESKWGHSHLQPPRMLRQMKIK